MLLSNRYQVIKKLGEGGFGQTFLAQDIQMPSKRFCVIKQLKPTTTSPQIFQLIQERFQREAVILEKLGERSRQIPSLYAYFNENKQFYLIQEWIEGPTLDELIHSRNLLTEDAVRKILLNLLPVLEFIHNEGIIHRDIKPENIIIRKDDQMPVLIDFGAVRETMGTVFNSRGNPTSSIVIGTPGYMPSEQAAGRPIASSDLYSLGLTAIYALTGKTPPELITDPQSGEILWCSHAPHLSASFAEILEKATRSHPRDRYSSAGQMLSALQGKMSHNSTPHRQNVQRISTPVTVAVSPAQSTPVPRTQLAQSRSPFILPSLILGGLIGASILIGVFLAKTNSPVVDQPSTPTRAAEPTPHNVSSNVATPSPTITQISPSPTPQAIPQTNSKPSVPEGVASPITSPEPNRSTSQPLSKDLFLTSSSGSRVDIYDQPSLRSASPHYGVNGDRVTALEQRQGEDSRIWYFVRFPSGADGWVRSDFVRSSDSLNAAPKSVQFPRSGRIAGQSPGSRVNVRSAPSTRSDSPHYGLVGDRVTALKQSQGEDGKTWYFVQFSSGATGWVRADFVELQ